MGLTRPKYNNLDTSKFEIGDPITEINVNVDPANPNNSDIGFIFNRGTTGDNVGLLWDKSAQEFVLVSTSATGSNVGDLPITSYQNFQCNDINANLVTSSATSPTAVDHLTRKDYVDTQVSAKVNRTGDTMTGNLTVRGSDNPRIFIRPLSDVGATSPGYSIQDSSGINRGLLYTDSNQLLVLRSYDAAGATLGVLTFSSDGNLSLAKPVPTSVSHLTRKDYVDAGDDYNNVTILNSSNDLDLILTNGRYTWTSSKPVNNPPGNAGYKHMIVETDGSQYSQLVWGGTTGVAIIALRRRDNGIWQAWEMFAKESSASGSFTTADSKTVTVVNGIITSIV